MDIKANRGQVAAASPSDQKTGSLPSFPGIEVRTMKQDLEALSKKASVLASAKPEPKPEPIKTEAKPVVPLPAPPQPAPPSPGPSRDELLKQEEKKREEERIRREQERERERLERERERLQKEQEEKAKLEQMRKLEEAKKKEEEALLQKEQADEAKMEIEKLVSSFPAKTAAPPPGLPTQASASPPVAPAVSAPVTPAPPARPQLAPAPAVVADFLTASGEPAASKMSTGKKKLILVVLVLAAAFLSAGIWIFWLISAKPLPSPSPSPSLTPSYSPSPSPSVLPTAFFRMDGEESIVLRAGESLAQKVQDLATSTPVGNFIKLSVYDNQQEMDLAKVASALKVDIFDLPTQKCENPEQCAGIGYLKDDLDMEKFSLFYYSQTGEDGFTSPFNAEAFVQARIGLVVALKDQSTSTAARLERNLEQLESFMASSLQGFFLGKKTETPIPPAFQDNIYQGVKLRYMNLPNSGLTIDYALVNGNLLFTTSKESMFSAIERCLQQDSFLP